ncbi:MAG TPA: twin-arginine translocase TatA/TatE family subunit [Candidatus Binataceae bacterium]|nr:twin-arginine translocase TatA/TatE family subunit [Candidatus Binataceae bacterium]
MDLFAPSHLLILLLIILVIFGPSKLGDVGGAMGRAIKDFKRAMNDDAPAAAAPPKSVANADQPTSEKPVNPS